MELLIRIIDKSTATMASKAGDVITIQEDGWPWSTTEMNNPAWIIVRTNITQTEAQALLAGDYTQNADGSFTLNIPKRYKVDLLAGNLVKPDPPRIIAVPVSQFRKIFGLK